MNRAVYRAAQLNLCCSKKCPCLMVPALVVQDIKDLTVLEGSQGPRAPVQQPAQKNACTKPLRWWRPRCLTSFE